MQAARREFPKNYSGRLQVEYTKSLAKLFTFERQNYVRPDCFDSEGNWYRLLDINESLTAIKITSSGLIFWGSRFPLPQQIILDQIHRLVVPIELPVRAVAHLPISLAEKLINLAPLVHIASASFEEAITKAIIRQVISANHAKRLIHRFITRFGENYEYEGFMCYKFPTPEKILEVPLEDLVSCGLGFKAKLIKNTVKWIKDYKLYDKFENMIEDSALENMQNIKGIGEWTARIVICDLLGNWSLYPFYDLAVRTWASKLWPDRSWPSKPGDFRIEWEKANGADVGQITFYLLALAAQLSEKGKPE